MSNVESKSSSNAEVRPVVPWVKGGALLAFGVLLGLLLGEWRGASEGPLEVRSASEMETEVRTALREVGAFDRAHALGRVLRSLDGENVEGAARAVRLGVEYLDPIVSQLFLSAWAGFDPLAAMEEARSWPTAVSRDLGMRTVAREWAASGRYLSAVNYYQSLDDAGMRSMLLGPLLRGWAQSGDVDGALDRARVAWERIDQPEAAVDGFARGALAVLGPEAMAARISELEGTGTDDFEKRLILASIGLLANERPDQAARLYSHFAGDSPPGWLDGGLALIASPWSVRDPLAAIEWLLEEPDGPQRTLELKNAVRAWTLQDLGEAWGWWQDQASDAEARVVERPVLRSILLAPALRALARVRPAEAAQWVDQVGQPAGRQVLVQRIAHFWAQRDETAALDWARGLELAPEDSVAVEAAIANGVAKAAKSGALSQ